MKLSEVIKAGDRSNCVTFFAQFNADQTYNFKKIVTKDWEEKYGVILVL